MFIFRKEQIHRFDMLYRVSVALFELDAVALFSVLYSKGLSNFLSSKATRD